VGIFDLFIYTWLTRSIGPHNRVAQVIANIFPQQKQGLFTKSITRPHKRRGVYARQTRTRPQYRRLGRPRGELDQGFSVGSKVQIPREETGYDTRTGVGSSPSGCLLNGGGGSEWHTRSTRPTCHT